MKVVAVVVIFVVIWRWAGSTPLPCGNSDCDPIHHCKHMHSNEIDRSKREFTLKNITSSIKRAAITVRNKLHNLGKRENAKFHVEDQVSEISNSSTNHSSIENTNGRFKRENVDQGQVNNTHSAVSSAGDDYNKTGSIFGQVKNPFSRIERQTSPNENVTEIAQNKLQNTEYGTQTRSTAEKVVDTLNKVQISQNLFNSNNNNEAQNGTKVKNEEPNHRNDTKEIENTSSQSVNITVNTQNTTRVKKHTSQHIHNATQEIGYDEVKTADDQIDNKDTKNTTRVTRQTPDHSNNSSEISANLTRQISDYPENDSQDIQNITTVKRQTYFQYHNNLKRQVSDTTNSTETQNTTMAKKQTDLKNSTKEAENNSINENQEYPTTKVVRQISEYYQDDAQENQNRTRLTRQISGNLQNTTEVGSNNLSAQKSTKKLRVQVFYMNNNTVTSPNATIVKRQTYNKNSNSINENQEYPTTKVVRQISEYYQDDAQENQNTTRLTRQISGNLQNTTEVGSNNLSAQKSTKKLRVQVFYMNNNTVTSPNATIVKRQTYNKNSNAQNIFNKSIAERQTTNLINDAEVAHKSKVKIQYFAGTRQGLRFERESTALENDTQVTENKTTSKNDSFDSRDTLKEGKNTIIVKTRNANYDDNTSVAENSTLNRQNTTEIAEITNVNKRQTVDVENNTTEPSIGKRNAYDTNSSQDNESQTTVSEPLSNFENTTLNSHNTKEIAKITNVNKRQTVDVENNTTETSIGKRNSDNKNSPQPNESQTTVQEPPSNFENTTLNSHNTKEIAEISNVNKRQTVDVENNSTESFIGERNSDDTNSSQDNESQTTVQEPLSNSENTTLNSHNTKEIAEISNVNKRQTVDVENNTTEPSIGKINSDNKNSSQPNESQTTVQEPPSNFENTTLNSHNTKEIAEISNVNKRQTVDVENNSTEPSIDERNSDDTNSSQDNESQTTVQEPFSNFKNSSQEIQKRTEARRQTLNSPEISDTIILFGQISNLQNDSTKDTEIPINSKNATQLKFDAKDHYPTVPKNIKTVKRQIIRETTTETIADKVNTGQQKSVENTQDEDQEGKEDNEDKEDEKDKADEEDEEDKEDEEVEKDEKEESKEVLDREGKDCDSSKNITIHIQGYIDRNQNGKGKRNIENITKNTSAVDIKEQSFITKRYAYLVNKNASTNLNSVNSTTTINTENTLIQNITSFNANETHQDGEVLRRRRQSSKGSQNSSLGSIAVHVTFTKTNNPATNNTTLRERRKVFELPPYSVEHLKKHTSHNHAASRDFKLKGEAVIKHKARKVKGNTTRKSVKHFKKRRSTDCNDELDTSGNDQEYQYTRRATEPFADHQTDFNNSNKVINTSINHKDKQDQQETGKGLDSAVNKTENNEHGVINSRSVDNVTMPQNGHIMKISNKARQAVEGNGTISNSRKRRWVFLSPTSQDEEESTEQSAILSESYLENDDNETSQHTPLMFLPRPLVINFAGISKTNDNNSGDDSIQFSESFSTEDKKENTNKVSGDEAVDDYYQHKVVSNDKTDDGKYNLAVTNNNIPYRLNSNYFGRTSNEKLDEEDIDMNMVNPLKLERVRCSCAMYRSDLSNHVKNPSFADIFVDIPVGQNGTDKELLCIRNCSEMAKVDINIKQEIYCAYHVKADSKNNEKNFPEISEVIFCQVYTRDNEPTLQFVLSWVNIVLLDVVVCVTGLGIVSMYLICFVTWRKRDNGPVYTKGSFAAK